MRPKKNLQESLDLQPSGLKLTQMHFARYEAISRILDATPQILNEVHRDLEAARKEAERKEAERCRRAGRSETPRSEFRYETDTVLRILVVQTLEGWSLRETVVRIDDSAMLRRFTRIHFRSMMDYTTLCSFKNQIQPGTWQRINRHLAEHAVKCGAIEGDKLRLDTTAVETNIHYPTDSSLLWDGYRVLDRWLRKARRVDPEAVGEQRSHSKHVKRLQRDIARKAGKKGSLGEVDSLYMKLISSVERIAEWSVSVRDRLRERVVKKGYADLVQLEVSALLAEMERYAELVGRVIEQAQRRVLKGEAVPNDKKVFSLFESHTELLKRGKAGKEVEFGHMIQIQQVEQKFITGYGVYAKRPAEPTLIQPALRQHETLFGHLPSWLATDKGYYESPAQLRVLEKKVDVVSICKKGRRSVEEDQRESDPFFRLAQAFRAGVEGSISFLKRCFRLARCFNKGWEHYQSTVGATIFSHNLVVLARL